MLDMFAAEIRLYQGRKPSVEQLKYIDDKICKLVLKNFVKELKIKNDTELKKLINNVILTEKVAKAKSRLTH